MENNTSVSAAAELVPAGATCPSSGDLRRLRSHRRQMALSARAVCSIVSFGFFPPEPSGLLGDEQHHGSAEDHVSEQPLVTSALEVAEADLGFDQPEGV